MDRPVQPLVISYATMTVVGDSHLARPHPPLRVGLVYELIAPPKGALTCAAVASWFCIACAAATRCRRARLRAARERASPWIMRADALCFLWTSTQQAIVEHDDGDSMSESPTKGKQRMM